MKYILLVEDDVYCSNVLVEMLKKEGYEVRLVEDGALAIPALKEKVPDLMILDILLPHKNGFEIIEEVSRDPVYRDLKIIVLSALDQAHQKRGLGNFTILEHIAKTEVSIKELLEKVKGYVA